MLLKRNLFWKLICFFSFDLFLFFLIFLFFTEKRCWACCGSDQQGNCRETRTQQLSLHKNVSSGRLGLLGWTQHALGGGKHSGFCRAKVQTPSTRSSSSRVSGLLQRPCLQRFQPALHVSSSETKIQRSRRAGFVPRPPVPELFTSLCALLLCRSVAFQSAERAGGQDVSCF